MKTSAVLLLSCLLLAVLAATIANPSGPCDHHRWSQIEAEDPLDQEATQVSRVGGENRFRGISPCVVACLQMRSHYVEKCDTLHKALCSITGDLYDSWLCAVKPATKFLQTICRLGGETTE